jgi:hypothetical protein
MTACCREDTQKLPIVHVKRIIGQKDLQAAYPGFDECRYFLTDDLIRGVGDDLMEAVIHHGCAGAALIFGQCVGDPVPLELGGKTDRGGCPAGKTCGATGQETLFVDRTIRFQLFDMAVCVNAARHDQQTVGVDALVAGQMPA